MKEAGARDRLVMAGLVVLGLLTVVAGVLSGRSTINYVLSRDAREAALSWASDINRSLTEGGPHAPQLLDRPFEVVNPDGFSAQNGKPAGLPANATSKRDVTLVEDLARLTTGWLMSHMSPEPNEFVSELALPCSVPTGSRSPWAAISPKRRLPPCSPRAMPRRRWRRRSP